MPVQPPDLSAAAALLPARVRWGDVLATAVAALLAAGGGGWVASRIALARVRRLDGAPWPERARVSFAARQAMVMSASALAFVCSALPLMPAQLGRDAFPALALATLGVLALVCGGAVWIGRCAGLVRPAGALAL